MKRRYKLTILIASVAIQTLIFVLLYYSISPQRSLFIDPIYRFNTEEKVVALTFDDGPSAKWTPLLLDLLKRHTVKATFFMVGRRILKNPEIAKRVVDEGHEVGHHTMEHNRMIFRSPTFIENDIKKMNSLFTSIGIEKVYIYRPPYGNKLIALPLVLKRLGMKMVTWDTDPEEQYDRDRMDSEAISDYVLKNVMPGSIILLHDGWSGDPKPFLDAVKSIITGLRKKSYNFCTISRCITGNKSAK